VSGGGPGLFAGLRHRDFRYFVAAFTTSSIGTWAYNVALAVWLLQETGSTGWVAASTVCRFVPALLFSAYAGVLAERFERVRLLVTLDLLLCAVMVAMAVEMAVGAPPELVVLTAAVSSTLGITYEPASVALTPELVDEQALGSANALRNTVDNVCVVAGPGLGGLLLLVGPPWVTLAVNAATFLVSGLLVAMVRTRSVPVDVTEGGEVGPLRQMLVGISAIRSSTAAATLVAFSIVATFVFGVDTVLFVVLSDEVLGTGPEGYGYLLAGLGVGGLLVAGLVPRLERLPRLGVVIWLGMAFYCLPTLLFLVVDEPAAAFVIQCVRGAATLVVDVLAVTALQRSLPHDVLGRVFGAFNALMLLAILIGSSLVPVVIHTLGLDALLWASGLGVPALCLLGAPRLRRMDREAGVRRTVLAPKVDLLTRCDLFASVGEGALDQLAGASEFVDVAAGAVLVREGDPADVLYVIESGVFAATARGAGGEVPLQDMGAGGYFGEIGLLERMPRTATVTALTQGRVLRVDGEAFLDALTQYRPSAALRDGAALRLARTHPGRRPAAAGIGDPGT
jgi:predicted MFS family arabinose efflux permease